VNKAKRVIPIWQPFGFSTHKIAKRVGEYYNEKATHTGTLDPLAEGVILILVGDARFKKSKYSDYKKTYEFEISLGISTDSYDGMGKIMGYIPDTKQPSKEKIKKVLSSFSGDYEQEVPLYSTIKVEGKSLFEWGHAEKRPKKMPRRRGVLSRIKLLETRSVSVESIIKQNISKIRPLKNDFRQEEILPLWENLSKKLGGTSSKISQIRIKVTTTRGIYIRSLSQDICKKLGVLGFVSTLVRVKNGLYIKSSCYHYPHDFRND